MKKFICLTIAYLLAFNLAFACEHGQKTAQKSAHQKPEKLHQIAKEKTA